MSNNFNPDSVDLVATHLINGERIAAGDAIEVFRPSDGLAAKPIPVADEATVDRAVQSAYKAFKTSGWAEASPTDRASVLHKWADLLVENREKIAQEAPIQEYGAGEIIVSHGAAGDSLYIILDGACEVLLEKDGYRSKKMATIAIGNFFGEMSLLTGEVRSATVKALEYATVIRVDKKLVLQ